MWTDRGRTSRGPTEQVTKWGWASGRARTHKPALRSVGGRGWSPKGGGEKAGGGEKQGSLGPGCGSRGGERSPGGGSRALRAVPPARSLAAVALTVANMLPRLGGLALPLLLPPLLLLLGADVRAEVLFRCPPCTPERLAACGATPAVSGAPCAELVREPGCGCCSVCARLEGEACGVYTPRCAQGLRCYPHPDSELPLQALVLGAGTCEKRRDAEYGTSPEQVAGNAGWDN